MRACGIIFMLTLVCCNTSMGAHESLSNILPRRMTSEYCGLRLPNLYGIAHAVVGGLSLYFYFYGEEENPSAKPDPFAFPTGLDESYAPIGNFFVTHRPLVVFFLTGASLYKKYYLRNQIGPMCFLIYEAYRLAALKLSEEGQKPNFPELAELTKKLEKSEKLEGQKLFKHLDSTLKLHEDNNSQIITNMIILADRKSILFRLCMNEANSNKSPAEIIIEYFDEIIQQISPDKKD